MDNKLNSENLFKEAQQYITGIINYPIEKFKNLSYDYPRFIKSAKGSYLYDVDWNKYIDYVGSFGSMILGHGDDDILSAIEYQLKNGLSYGSPCKQEIDLAKKIIELMPSIEQLVFVNSPIEANISAIRVARSYTNKNKIIKFEGCYHGYDDKFLIPITRYNMLNLNQNNYLGIPKDVAKDILIANFNDIESVQILFKKYKNEIACIIIEPITSHMNMIFPQNDFLIKLRDICDENNSLLIFDEVVTGFRVALNGAQGIYNVKPDLTTLGKIIGGGMPIGAFGGRKDIMKEGYSTELSSEINKLFGNPIIMIAGIKTLEKISQNGFFNELEAKSKKLINSLNKIAKSYDFNFHAKYLGGMFGLFFCSDKISINTFLDLSKINIRIFHKFFTYMLDNGIYISPSTHLTSFISIAHSNEDIQKTIFLVKKFFRENYD